MVQCFASFRTLSPDNPIPGCSTGAHTEARALQLLKRKENSSQGFRRRPEVRLRCRKFILILVQEY